MLLALTSARTTTQKLKLPRLPANGSALKNLANFARGYMPPAPATQCWDTTSANLSTRVTKQSANLVASDDKVPVDALLNIAAQNEGHNSERALEACLRAFRKDSKNPEIQERLLFTASRIADELPPFPGH